MKKIVVLVASIFALGLGFSKAPEIESKNEKEAENAVETEVENATELETLTPESKEFITWNAKSSIKITSSKAKTAVYINDEFYGRTPLIIEDLTEAKYIMRLEKSNCEMKSFLIEVKSGLHQEFFVEL